MALELVNKLPYDHPYRWDGTLFGGQKLWRPSELGADLALWLDAEDTDSITLNGGNVAQWSDKSGNGYNATQATAASQPTYKASDAVLGGKPSVGAPTNDVLIGLLTPSFTAQRYFVVTAFKTGVETTFGSQYHTLLSGSGEFGVERAGMGLIATSNWFEPTWGDYPFRNGAATNSASALPLPMSMLDFRGASSVTQNWGIGYNQATLGRNWMGPIGEVIATTGTLSTLDRQKLEGYLAWKWGLTANLPADHPYKTTPPTV